MAIPACGLTLIKHFPYRDQPTEEFSNQYWFTGSAPTNDVEWKSLADALVAAENKIMHGGVVYTDAYGYNDATPKAPAVSHIVFPSGAPYLGIYFSDVLTEQGCAGDQAAWIRWATARRTIHGKVIYLRKYYHAPHAALAQSGADALSPHYKTALGDLATLLASPSGVGFGPLTGRGHVDVIQSHATSSWVTTRTLERRGKRKKLTVTPPAQNNIVGPPVQPLTYGLVPIH